MSRTAATVLACMLFATMILTAAIASTRPSNPCAGGYWPHEKLIEMDPSGNPWCGVRPEDGCPSDQPEALLVPGHGVWCGKRSQ